jgi:hypothetical protein
LPYLFLLHIGGGSHDLPIILERAKIAMWYSVWIFMESLTDPPESRDDPGLWEEVVYLVDADSEASAEQMAAAAAKEEEQEYVSAEGKLVRWQFKAIERTACVGPELRGIQSVCSRYITDAEARSLLSKFAT